MKKGEEKLIKKMINTSFVYLILALISGVFYREFTKFNGFTEKTTLGVVHTHLFVLGVLLFLILALFLNNCSNLLENTKIKKFYILYNLSLIMVSITLLVRGIIQVLNINLSSTMNAALSGFAGISHILLTISLVLFFFLLKRTIKN